MTSQFWYELVPYGLLDDFLDFFRDMTIRIGAVGMKTFQKQGGLFPLQKFRVSRGVNL